MPDYPTDRPLDDPQYDDFQRAAFAERLAQTLLAPSHTASIVVGLYGKWGEGKSTVLNFVQQHLAARPESVVVVPFNPWLFPDEAKLLPNFIAQLARAIKQPEPEEPLAPEQTQWQKALGIGKRTLKKNDRPLHNRTESLVALASEYAGGTSLAGVGLGKVFALAIPDLTQLRQRMEEAITASGKRVVVILDDIDRLEKSQIQAVFRLVKLTANFRNTAYLLAFDEVMVARAIGEMFAGGATADAANPLSDGQNFLEKIIQVPLRLPRARQPDLLRYLFARVEEALTDTHTELDSETARRKGEDVNSQRFTNVLRRAILPRLTTPRLAIRYANALRFSLPLLRNEVNTVDHLLVEALGIFYPDLHQFIAARQGDFAGSGQIRRVLKNLGGSDEPGVNIDLQNLFQQHSYTAESVAGAKTLLTDLFPRLATEANEWAHLEDTRNRADIGELGRLQAVASPLHFSRYFSYSVALSDVSDQEFVTLLQSEGFEQLAYFRDFAQRLSTNIVLERLTYRLPDFSFDQSRTLFGTLTQAADLYRPSRNWSFETSEVLQASNLLLKLLAQLPEPSERDTLARALLNEGGSFELAYQFDQQLQRRRSTESITGTFGEATGPPPLFPPESWDSLLRDAGRLLLTRALREAGDRPLYLTHPAHAGKLLRIIWPQLDLSPGPVHYVFQHLAANPSELVNFLEVNSQHISTPNKSYYRGGLSISQFEQLRGVFGQHLYELTRDKLGNELVENVDFEDPDEPTPKQRLQQYAWLAENHPLPATT